MAYKIDELSLVKDKVKKRVLYGCKFCGNEYGKLEDAVNCFNRGVLDLKPYPVGLIYQYLGYRDWETIKTIKIGRAHV